MIQLINPPLKKLSRVLNHNQINLKSLYTFQILLLSLSRKAYNKKYQNGTDDVQRVFSAIRQKANENTHG